MNEMASRAGLLGGVYDLSGRLELPLIAGIRPIDILRNRAYDALYVRLHAFGRRRRSGGRRGRRWGGDGSAPGRGRVSERGVYGPQCE